MTKKITAGIIGGAGYTGGEMIRLLLNHPETEILFVHSRSHAGHPVHQVHKDLLGDTDLSFTDQLQDDVDVLFLCVGHSETRTFMEQHSIPGSVRIIDLSQDFRLDTNNTIGDRGFVYGLPEYNRDGIRNAHNVANPGCFATAIQLALLPLGSAGFLSQEVHVTGITGATGAGQKLQASSHFSWRASNVQAYKSLAHQHSGEVMQTLQHMQTDAGPVLFMPWRGDFPRGIYISAYTRCDLSLEEAYQLYEAYYDTHPFTRVSRLPTDLKQVVNTNKCLLHLEYAEGRLIIHSAIDNLLKGASGQAVQNMNLMFGLAEDAGLKLKSIVF